MGSHPTSLRCHSLLASEYQDSDIGFVFLDRDLGLFTIPRIGNDQVSFALSSGCQILADDMMIVAKAFDLRFSLCQIRQIREGKPDNQDQLIFQ